MDSRCLKFNVYFKAFIAFLKDSFPEHGTVADLEVLFDTMNVIQPGTMRQFFNEHICKPYEVGIVKCEVSVFDDIHARGDDFLNVYEMWKSPSFDELKKAQCFQHLIRLCHLSKVECR